MSKDQHKGREIDAEPTKATQKARVTAQRACVSEAKAQRACADHQRDDAKLQRGIGESFVEQTFRISAFEERYYCKIDFFVG